MSDRLFIKIDPTKLREESDNITLIKRKNEEILNGIKEVEVSVKNNWIDDSTGQLVSKINAVEECLNMYIKNLDNCSNYLRKTADEWNNADK